MDHLNSGGSRPSEIVTPASENALREQQLAEWIAYADKLERVLEMVCGASKDRLTQMHAEQGLRIVRPARG